MSKPIRIMQAALATLVVAACGSNTSEVPPPGPEGYATVRVENQSISEMRIYVRPGAGGSRFRLGSVSGLQTQVLKIPRSMVTGVTDLVFEIDPLAGGRSSFSERITAHPGEEIVLRISGP
ncbi:MAG TPA: hypothetical protein VGQ69_08455 [Gemmatimonadales bacterium]|jgi:hypothetical protein|nr:hypothetical protein [Gemmatimonadales bacterium]